MWEAELDSKTPTTKHTTTPSRTRRIGVGAKLLFLLMLLGIIFVAGIVAALFWTGQLRWNSQQVTPRATVERDGNALTSSEENTVASVAEKVNKSVVSIVTTTVDMTYFGASEQEGAGTGIIVGRDGYVMTNKHVVEGARTVTIIQADGTKHEDVKVLGTDPLNDVAFLKIDNVRDLPAVELGDSTTVRVGQSVIAIGNSLGQYQNTVTKGIISGTGRPIRASTGASSASVETLTDLLQTDAAINPGNSGGPLLNTSGQVIGINTAVAADAEGIGFSIPINATKGILKRVLAGESVERAYLGVQSIPLTPIIAEEYKLSVKRGAYVVASGSGSAIVPNSPADKAGLKDRDIITKINGVNVGSKGSVSTLIGEYAVGDTVEITVMRGDRTHTLKATLVAYPN